MAEEIPRSDKAPNVQATPPPENNSGTNQNSNVTVRRELEQIRRIVNGANKRLDRLCNEIADK